MRAATSTEFAAVSLTIAQGLGTGLALMPSLAKVRDGDIDNAELVIDVRHAEATVALITLSTGALGSIMLKSPFPIIASAGIMFVLIVAYEISLRMQVTYTEGYTHD